MNDAISKMMARYSCQTREDYLNALREILQELALLGLWRANFFSQAAFYGGTALRVLYGLDRFSEDLDFSLLQPTPGFTLEGFGESLKREISSYGFDITFERRSKARPSVIESAFLKASTVRELIHISANEQLARGLHSEAQIKIKLEVDVDPPVGFSTETKFLLDPIPFPVRVYTLPDLFAGKLHAILCRNWGSRVKGRDWYDMVWYAARHPQVNVSHLEQRMRQSGHWNSESPLTFSTLIEMLESAASKVDIAMIRNEVAPFVRDNRSLDAWSNEFFLSVVQRIQPANDANFD
jgi:predicted nucleotidyltransferase component of viral defense system